jgi:hypothetical protein
MNKIMRVLEYIVTCEDHKLVLCPKSLQLIASSDASYGEHSDGKSQTGGTVGFEDPNGQLHCWVIAVSSKQPVIAKSTGECELIAGNVIGDFVVWTKDMIEDIGVKQKCIKFGQDNETAILNATRGYGSFKRSKHIKVRFFWLKMLIDDEVIELVHIATEELVADILTKPLVGARFRYLRAKLLNWGTILI